LEDPCVNGRVILRWNFRKCDVGHGMGRSGSGKRQVAVTCECGNEISGSIKCGEYLNWLRSSQLLKKDSAPWRK